MSQQSSREQSTSQDSPSKSEPKPVPLVFKQLVTKVDEENPEQFRLPQELRQFFAGGEDLDMISA